MPAPTASDLPLTPTNGDPMDMLNHLRTGSLSPVESGGAGVSVAVEERVDSPPPSTPAESSVDSAVTLHFPSGETSSCPNVAWGAVKKPPRPSLTMGTGLREEVMRRDMPTGGMGLQCRRRPGLELLELSLIHI